MTAEGHLGKSPLLGDDDAKHAGLGSSEIPRISWRRAIGVFHLYLAWLIAELIALYVPSRARRPAPSADARATHRGLSSSGASRFFSPAAPPLFSPLTSLARLPSLHSTRAPDYPPRLRALSAVGLTALTTDHWIVPSGAALPFLEHAGLWKVCFSASPTQAEGRATDDVDTFSRVEDWWRTVDDAFLQIDDDQKRLTRETSGCTRRVAEFYGHVWGKRFRRLVTNHARVRVVVPVRRVPEDPRRVSNLRSRHKRTVVIQRVRGFPRDHSNRVRRSRLVHRLGDAHKSARRRAVLSRPRNL
jgi:hypothetical protein